MTELDQVLADFMDDEKNQDPFYNLVLNSKFYMPVHSDDAEIGEKQISQDANIQPLIVESEDNHYLVMFDTEERLTDWAQKAVNYVVLPGFVIVQMTPDKLHWAMNMGTDYPKQFVPEEITWLKEVVQQNLQEAEKSEG